ncbi:MAG: hypothetical protein FWG01_00875 [Betaproteobacteria bacterium]|nr:hypothetical protein [Betaproteobacteria bacterium]
MAKLVDHRGKGSVGQQLAGWPGVIRSVEDDNIVGKSGGVGAWPPIDKFVVHGPVGRNVFCEAFQQKHVRRKAEGRTGRVVDEPGIDRCFAHRRVRADAFGPISGGEFNSLFFVGGKCPRDIQHVPHAVYIIQVVIIKHAPGHKIENGIPADFAVNKIKMAYRHIVGVSRARVKRETEPEQGKTIQGKTA